MHGSCPTLVFVCLALAAAVPARAQGRAPESSAADRLEEVVKGPRGEELVKVTHIFRRAKGKPAPACTCASPEGTTFGLEKVKWSAPGFSYTIYTLRSGLGTAAADAVRAGFAAWKAARPAAPSAGASQNDVAPGPGIALDGEQNVSWQPLSAGYGADTLAVTVYWYSRSKTGGFSGIVHFDMAFNTDYAWSIGGLSPVCGPTSSTAFDVEDIATHEAGHVYGLAHDNGCNLTMNPTAAPGETLKSTLALGDISGIAALY